MKQLKHPKKIFIKFAHLNSYNTLCYKFYFSYIQDFMIRKGQKSYIL